MVGSANNSSALQMKLCQLNMTQCDVSETSRAFVVSDTWKYTNNIYFTCNFHKSTFSFFLARLQFIIHSVNLSQIILDYQWPAQHIQLKTPQVWFQNVDTFLTFSFLHNIILCTHYICIYMFYHRLRSWSRYCRDWWNVQISIEN